MSFDTVERWKFIEKVFSVNDYQGIPSQKSWILYKKYGNLPVMFSAPHATKHIREGKVKVEDFGTGGIAVVSALRAKATALAMAGNQLADANWDTDHPYKEQISQWRTEGGRIVFDIHGTTTESSKELGADIVLGLSEHQNVCNRYIANLVMAEAAKRGISAKISGGKFSAEPNTITDYCMSSGIYAVQIALSPKLRKAPSDIHHGADKVIELLAKVAKDATAMLAVFDVLRPEYAAV